MGVWFQRISNRRNHVQEHFSVRKPEPAVLLLPVLPASDLLQSFLLVLRLLLPLKVWELVDAVFRLDIVFFEPVVLAPVVPDEVAFVHIGVVGG